MLAPRHYETGTNLNLKHKCWYRCITKLGPTYINLNIMYYMNCRFILILVPKFCSFLNSMQSNHGTNYNICMDAFILYLEYTQILSSVACFGTNIEHRYQIFCEIPQHNSTIQKFPQFGIVEKLKCMICLNVSNTVVSKTGQKTWETLI